MRVAAHQPTVASRAHESQSNPQTQAISRTRLEHSSRIADVMCRHNPRRHHTRSRSPSSVSPHRRCLFPAKHARSRSARAHATADRVVASFDTRESGGDEVDDPSDHVEYDKSGADFIVSVRDFGEFRAQQTLGLAVTTASGRVTQKDLRRQHVAMVRPS